MKNVVLITGATGMIGSKLASLCLDEGMTVHYFHRDKNKIVSTDNLCGFYWNPQNNEMDMAAFEGVEAIIHLAGAPIAKRWTSSYKQEIIDSRIQPIRLMYENLAQIPHSVDHFITASGINIYPDSATKLYTEEDMERSDNFITSVVEQWEAEGGRFKELGMEVSKIRTGMVLAREGGVLPTLSKPIKFGLGSPLGSGEQWQSWIHIDDIVGIYMFVLQNTMEGIYNAVAPNPVKNKRLVHLIAEKLNKPLWLPAVPSFVLKTVLGEMGSLPLESQLISSNKLKKVGYVFKYPN